MQIIIILPINLSHFSYLQCLQTVASVSDCDEDYNKALGDPLYTLIREALYSSNKSGEVLEEQELKSEAHSLPNENLIEGAHDDVHDTEQKVHSNDHHAGESSLNKAKDTKRKAFCEIEEEESEESTCVVEGIKAANQPSANKFADANGVNAKKRIYIRPEVEEEALGTLEKAISIVRQYGFNGQNRSSSYSDEGTPNLEEGAVKETTTAAKQNVCLKDEFGLEAASKKFAEKLEMISDDSMYSSDNNDTR